MSNNDYLFGGTLAPGTVINASPNPDLSWETVSYTHLDVYKRQPQKREICLMKVREELSNQEIADRLKLSINTIKTHYSDARCV